MSEERSKRWIIKWDSGDGVPYYTGDVDDPWSAKQRKARRFDSLGKAVRGAQHLFGHYSAARPVRLVPKRKAVSP